MPISKPRSSAMRAEVGSNTDAGWTQAPPARIARNFRRRSLQSMSNPRRGARPILSAPAAHDLLGGARRARALLLSLRARVVLPLGFHDAGEELATGVDQHDQQADADRDVEQGGQLVI